MPFSLEANIYCYGANVPHQAMNRLEKGWVLFTIWVVFSVCCVRAVRQSTQTGLPRYNTHFPLKCSFEPLDLRDK